MDAAAMAIAVGGNSGPGSISNSNSSSSSSASSGYGSATTTPTTPGGGGGGQYEGATASTSMPMATIATVAPFYSEALTSLDAQHRYQQQQQQQQQQHQQQQQQQHFYHQNYNYNLDAYNYSAYNYNGPRYEKLAAAATSAKYNININSSNSNSLGSNSQSNSLGNSLGSNSSSNKPQAAATPFYAQPPPTQQMSMSMPLPMGNYATNSNPYEAAYKYKLPQQPSQLQSQQQYHNLSMMPHSMSPHNLSMGMGMNLGAHKQHQQHAQQQHQQHAQQQHQHQQQQQALQQQQLPPLEPSYAAIKPSSRYQNLAPAVYGSPGATAAGTAATGTNAGSSAYYDKYAMSLYSPNGAPLSFGAPAPLYSPPELTAESAYRKSATAREASCHWSVDYQSAPSNAGSSALPYATPVAAPNTAAAAVAGAGNELYYKYDKYPGTNPYQSNHLAQPYAARGMWPNPADNAPPPNARQSCCTQPFPQQSCYYPRSNGYSSVPQYPASNAGHKLKHPTDLYYAEAAQRSYGYVQQPAGANTATNTPPTLPNSSQQQRYVQQLNMGGLGAVGLEANVSTAYYNDLSSLDNLGYAAAQQSHRAQPYQTGASLEYQYRKRPLPAAVAPAPASNSGYCLAQSVQPPLSNLSNLEAHLDSYVGYDLHTAGQAPHFAPQGHKTQNPPGAPSSNSSNIRDFLASWNDDEEELPTVCQLRGESAVELPPQAVAVVAPVAPVPPAPSSFMYETLPPAGPAATAVVEPQVSELNLPDIIIDHHEKAHVDDSFGSFDVEKELDELRLKKSDEQQTGDSDALAAILRDPVVVTEEPLPLALPLPLPSPIPIPATLPEAAEPQPSIEFDQGTSNSNESTFEKEYETFIHKIDDSDSETETKTTDNSESGEHAKRFKFYKRKRKTTEPNNEIADKVNSPAPPISMPTAKAAARASRKLLARRRRNRIKMLKILEFESPKIKHRFYFRTMKQLRRKFAQSSVRQQRMQRMRRQLALRKERRLPLIKRQSAMQFVQQPQQQHQPQQQQPQLQSPPSLKGLSASAVSASAETSTGRETVIKSGFAVRESLDCKSLESKTPQQPTETETAAVLDLDEHSVDSIHSLQSVELLGSFKGFDDVENINLSPKAKLREESEEMRPQQAKQLEIQRWLRNSMEDLSAATTTAATTIICLSSSSSSSSASTSSSSSSSSSSDDSSNSSSSSNEDKAEAASSSSSSCSGEESDFNELAALQKELAVEPKPNVELPANTELEQQESLEKVSNNDIAKLKQILESDGDADEEEAKAHQLSPPKSDAEQQVETSKVPKLSDLSKIALNSSLKSSELVIRNGACSPKPKSESQPQRELSVEEALAEMYQQIGVASDPEDCEAETEAEARKNLDESAAGADVLLINLAEIFDNNSSDLYVVQCDMNENILGVVNGGSEQQHQQQQQEDQADTLQLIELLAEPEAESEMEADGAQFIHHEEVVEVPSEKRKSGERQKFLKYLHSKYVQSNISRFYHAQRVLKKYKRRRPNLVRKSLESRVQSARAEVVDRETR